MATSILFFLTICVFIHKIESPSWTLLQCSLHRATSFTRKSLPFQLVCSLNLLMPALTFQGMEFGLHGCCFPYATSKALHLSAFVLHCFCCSNLSIFYFFIFIFFLLGRKPQNILLGPGIPSAKTKHFTSTVTFDLCESRFNAGRRSAPWMFHVPDISTTWYSLTNLLEITQLFL